MTAWPPRGLELGAAQLRFEPLHSSIVDLESRWVVIYYYIVLISMGSYFDPLADRVDRIGLGGGLFRALESLPCVSLCLPMFGWLGLNVLGVGILSISWGILPVYINE